MADLDHVELEEMSAVDPTVVIGESDTGEPGDTGADAPPVESDTDDSQARETEDPELRAPASDDVPAEEPVAGEVAVEEPVVEEVAVEEPVVEEVAVEEPVVEEVAVEAVAAELPAEDTVAAEPASEADDTEAEEEPPHERPLSPYDLPGDWYVIHSYSGYENKVKANLETRIRSMHMEDRIFEVHIPMEDVVEIKGGKKVTVPKKVFPGYILVRMTLDDDSWYAVRNTPGVTGFVGGTAKPTPLSRREVERFLGVQEEEEKVKPRFKPEWEVGDIVRVITGPFADFNGRIEDIDLDQSKVTVLVNIFGRDTPVELGFEDIQKS